MISETSKKMEYDKRNKWYIYSLIGALIIYYFYIKSSTQILNYPQFTILYLLLIIFIFLLIGDFVFLYQKKQGQVSTKGIISNILKFSILSWFISGVLLIPFNYYIIYSAKSNPIEKISCEIKSVFVNPKKSGIFYVFNGKVNVLYSYEPMLDEIKSSGNSENYQIVVQVRKSLFKTYVIEKWELKK